MKDALQLMVLLHLLFVVVPIFGNDGGYSLQYHGVLSGGLNIEVRLHARKFFACSYFPTDFSLLLSTQQDSQPRCLWVPFAACKV